MYESGALVTRPLAVFADGDLAGVDFGTGFGDLAGPFGLAAAVPGDFVRAGLFAGGRPFWVCRHFWLCVLDLQHCLLPPQRL